MPTHKARLDRLEARHAGPMVYIVRDSDGRYSVGNGERLTQQEYDAWALANNITPDTLHIIRIGYDHDAQDAY